MTEQHAELEAAQGYATGRLDPTASMAFEEHLLFCEQCQTEVRLSVGVRHVVRVAPAARSGQRARWIGGAAALLAASIAGFFVLPGRVDSNVAALGQVREPPMYIGMSVRSLPRHGDSLFASAMAAYVTRQYDRAASELHAALGAGADTIPAEFFIASSELMAGHPSEAAASYARVIGAGAAAGPYLPEAHLYRARALLRLGRTTDALSELDAVGPDDPEVAKHASSLADSVKQVMRR